MTEFIIALIAWGVTVGGTMCLALALSRLAARNPGGPQSYVQEAFGPTPAFFIIWMYWVSVFTSTAGIAVAFGGAASATMGALTGPAWVVPLAVGAIFVVTAINLRGVHSAGVAGQSAASGRPRLRGRAGGGAGGGGLVSRLGPP